MTPQNRNFILFLLLTFGAFTGYAWVKNKLWPPPPSLSREQFLAAEPVLNLTAFAAPPGAGVGDAARLGIQGAVNRINGAEYAKADFAARAEQAAKAHPPAPPPPKPAPLTPGGDD